MEFPVGSKYRTSKSGKVVGAFIQAIANALRRGETVDIKGFGKFYPHRTNPRIRSVNMYYGDGTIVGARYTYKVKPITTIRFKPYGSLVKFVNTPPEE